MKKSRDRCLELKILVFEVVMHKDKHTHMNVYDKKV